MPRVLKRRAGEISRSFTAQNDSGDDDDSPQPSQRPRNESPAEAGADSASNVSDEEDAETQTQKTTQILIKKLVRLALSTEYSRTPLRRADINAKVLKDTNSARSFKTVFAGAQRVLQDVFGMEMVELPSREKTGLNERRKAATQTQNLIQGQGQAKSSSAQSYILASTLPSHYKRQPTVLHPAKSSVTENEAVYTSLYTFILALIYLNSGSIAEAKMERQLRRVGMEQWSPLGMTLDKLLLRMSRDGYVEKRRDTSAGEEVVEWLAGPRGKIEVGEKGVAGLVRSVYGFGAVPLKVDDREAEDEEDDGAEQQPRRPVKMEAEELENRLKRSLGVSVPKDTRVTTEEDDVGGGRDTQANGATDQPRRTRTRRQRVNDDEDDD